MNNLWSRFKATVTGRQAQLIYRLTAFLAVVVVGVPMLWVYIPPEYRPQNFWDFFNSALLCYIAWHVTVKRVGCWIKD